MSRSVTPRHETGDVAGPAMLEVANGSLQLGEFFRSGLCHHVFDIMNCAHTIE
jgi:hypothetical protein